jgi:WD40 repeat protein
VAAKKKDALPPKPWEIVPFTDCFAFIGGHMLTGHALDNEVREWDLDVGLVLSARRKGRKNKDSIGAIAVRPGFEQFMVECNDALLLWALNAQAPVRELEAEGTRTLAWLDDRRFLSGDYNGVLKLWDLDAGKVLREMKHGDQVVALATDGKVAWTGGWDKVRSIKRCDLETGKSIGQMKLDKPCASMARSPDGSRVACVTFGGALHVFDWASGKELVNVPKAHDDRADGVAWTNDGEHIVTVSEFDETLRLFDAHGKALDNKSDLPRPARIGVGPDGIIYVAIAYKRIDRFRVTNDAFAAI